MRILVVQTAFLGDVVLTTPFIQALKERFESAEVHLVVRKEGAEVLDGISGLTFHILDKRQFFVGMKKIFKSLDKIEFDYVFVIHRSLRSLWIGHKVLAKNRFAFHSLIAKLLGFQTVIYPQYHESIHYTEKPLVLLDSARILSPNHDRRPVLVTSAEDEASAFELLSDTQDYIVLSPFSVWGTKMWFARRFAELGVYLASSYNRPIVLIGTLDQKETADKIAQKIRDSGGNILNLVGKTKIKDLKVVIKNAKLLISNDSAAVHIASAFNVPTVAIFGPTVKEFGFFPLSTRSVIVEKDVSCRPCNLHGPQKCPKQHFKCMDLISVQDVVHSVQRIW